MKNNPAETREGERPEKLRGIIDSNRPDNVEERAVGNV